MVTSKCLFPQCRPPAVWTSIRTSEILGLFECPSVYSDKAQAAAVHNPSHPGGIHGRYVSEQSVGRTGSILLVARQHWLVLLSETISEFLLTLAVLALVIAVSIFAGPLALLGLIILLAPAISLTRDILNWANRKYVITSRRVIQISGVISKNVADSALEKVNDVKLEQTFFGRLLGYGNIEILTASELGVNKI